ncbi:hypothetical protein [Shewanella sp.]|uniref:hypothetical protein n=1 Tax=Shewanella sp. TaxID=50422 RepID=UPI001ECF99CB|nr:hypothetical protein [Shewanella sp.]NRB25761.1 hypothetical protein [Shewanella sp.]
MFESPVRLISLQGLHKFLVVDVPSQLSAYQEPNEAPKKTESICGKQSAKMKPTA